MSETPNIKDRFNSFLSNRKVEIKSGINKAKSLLPALILAATCTLGGAIAGASIVSSSEKASAGPKIEFYRTNYFIPLDTIINISEGETHFNKGDVLNVDKPMLDILKTAECIKEIQLAEFDLFTDGTGSQSSVTVFETLQDGSEVVVFDGVLGDGSSLANILRLNVMRKAYPGFKESGEMVTVEVQVGELIPSTRYTQYPHYTEVKVVGFICDVNCIVKKPVKLKPTATITVKPTKTPTVEITRVSPTRTPSPTKTPKPGPTATVKPGPTLEPVPTNLPEPTATPFIVTPIPTIPVEPTKIPPTPEIVPPTPFD